MFSIIFISGLLYLLFARMHDLYDIARDRILVEIIVGSISPCVLVACINVNVCDSSKI